MKESKIINEKNDIEIRVRLKSETNIFFGPGAARLLELIDKGESVSEACKMMKMSYSKGWKILNIIKEETGYDAVIRHQGGSGGGKTVLSKEGIELLNAFRNMEADIKLYAKDKYKEFLGSNND